MFKLFWSVRGGAFSICSVCALYSLDLNRQPTTYDLNALHFGLESHNLLCGLDKSEMLHPRLCKNRQTKFQALQPWTVVQIQHVFRVPTLGVGVTRMVFTFPPDGQTAWSVVQCAVHCRRVFGQMQQRHSRMLEVELPLENSCTYKYGIRELTAYRVSHEVRPLMPERNFPSKRRQSNMQSVQVYLLVWEKRAGSRFSFSLSFFIEK